MSTTAKNRVSVAAMTGAMMLFVPCASIMAVAAVTSLSPPSQNMRTAPNAAPNDAISMKRRKDKMKWNMTSRPQYHAADNPALAQVIERGIHRGEWALVIRNGSRSTLSHQRYKRARFGERSDIGSANGELAQR